MRSPGNIEARTLLFAGHEKGRFACEQSGHMFSRSVGESISSKQGVQAAFRLFRPFTRKGSMSKTPKLIQSIERAVALLEIIAQQGGAARLRDLAVISGLGKTTAHNILQTLEQLGYVHRRLGDMNYYLGGRILNLSRIVGNDYVFRDKMRPVLEQIARESGATVYFAVPSGDKAAYVDIVDLKDPLFAASRLHDREKLEGSSVGLVFLAFVPGLGKRVLATRANALSKNILLEIENVRVKGYALDLESYRPGINAVAIPWRESSGEVRSSIALSGPATELPRQRLIQLAWMMMKHVASANLEGSRSVFGKTI